MSGIEDDPGPCVCTDCQNAREQGTSEDADEAEKRFLGLCPYCYSPMNGPCGHCIAEANASGTPFEGKRLKDLVCDREDTIIDQDAAIERMTAYVEDFRAAHRTLEGVIDKRNITIERLNAEAVETGVLVADLQTGLSDAITEVARLEKVTVERDATIERLWAQLNEATNVPDALGPFTGVVATAAREWVAHQDQHNDLEFGPTTNLLPTSPKLVVDIEPCPDSCGGQSWTGVDQADGPGKVWRCDTCGRIISQSVSNPLQAADDRRAL